MSDEQATVKYLLAHLACGHTVMQREDRNPQLFWLLQQVPEGRREVTLYCPEHRKQRVERLLTRTQQRPHWPLLGQAQCGCGNKIAVPPAPAENDEDTQPHESMSNGVYVQCPDCSRWGDYGYAGTGTDYYDIRHRKVRCSHCKQETLVSYNPYTTDPGEILTFTCMVCRKPFSKIYAPPAEAGQH